MARFLAVLLLPLLPLLLIAAAAPLHAQTEADYTLAPYSARYAIYRNGKLTGKMEISLERHGERWILRSEGSGTHGLARILAARDIEDVSGHVVDGRFRPDRYQRHTRVAGMDDRWTTDFDWDQRSVSVVHDKDDPVALDMGERGVGDALDPLSLKLALRYRLSRQEPELRFQMVEEEVIDEQNFRVLPGEWLETSLGCLRTTPVEKIRENSTRYTRAWHAPELDFIEVRLEHGKTGGNHLEMRITELTLDGA
ncbi:MAG: DUF3108 domain-containing protein, partial [Lysobacterales bacterium]